MLTIRDQVRYWGQCHHNLKIATGGFDAGILKEENRPLLMGIPLTTWHIEFAEMVIMPGIQPALKAVLREEIAFLKILNEAISREWAEEAKRQDAKTLHILNRVVSDPPPGKKDLRPYVREILAGPGMLDFVVKIVAPHPEIVEKFKLCL